MLEKTHALTQQSRDMHRVASILAAARNQFESRGYAAVTVDEIASEVGCSRATFYVHFPGKLEILEAISAEATSVMSSCEDLDRTLESRSQYEPERESVADSGAPDPVEFVADDIDRPICVVACTMVKQVQPQAVGECEQPPAVRATCRGRGCCSASERGGHAGSRTCWRTPARRSA
ncbi:helix-turn-helix domain-containing protein [Prescottella equi]